MQRSNAADNRFVLIFRRVTTIVCALSLTMITMSAGLAEDGNNPPPAYQHLKHLEPYVGKWQGKFDPPGAAPLGTVTFTCRWGGNKSYLLTEVFYTPEGTQVVLNQKTAIIGFNWKTKSLHTWEFGWVKQSSIPVVAADNKLTFEGGEVFSRSGTDTSKVTTIELTDANTMVTKSHQLIDGERVPHEDLTLKRVTAEQQ